MHYILAVHVPITGLAVLPLVTGAPLVLLPLHVVLLELIIDPACSIVFERESATDDIMRRPPRPSTQRLLGMRSLFGNLVQGSIMCGAVVAVYALGIAEALPFPQVGALAFTTIVSGNLSLILLYRAGNSMLDTLRKPNPAFWMVILMATTVVCAATRWELPAKWFGFSPPPLHLWLIALALPLALAALLKSVQRER